MSDLDPHRIERAFLGSVLAGEGDNDHLLATVREQDFTDPGCRRIFAEMAAARLRGVRLDARLVASFAPSPGLVSELLEAVSTPASADEYARRLSELGGLRELAKINGALISHEADSLTEAIATVRQRLTDIEAGRVRDRMANGEEMARELMTKLTSNAGAEGITTGLEQLDAIIGGLLPSALYVIAGRPGAGKSVLMTNLVEHQAFHHAARVALFSLEMPKIQLTSRMLASQGRIEQHRIKHKVMDDRDWSRASVFTSKIAASKLLVLDKTLTISEVYSQAKSEHAREPLALVVVDYLQLVKTAQKKNSAREQEVSEVARGLKALAMDLKIPVVAGAQLNREVEKRGDKRPVLADLRESGEIEQSADVVIMVHREYMTNKEAHPEEAELLVRKNRHGECGEMRVRFMGAFSRFEGAA